MASLLVSLVEIPLVAGVRMHLGIPDFLMSASRIYDVTYSFS